MGLPFKRKNNEVNPEKSESKLDADQPTDSVDNAVVEEEFISEDAPEVEEAPVSEEAPDVEAAPAPKETDEEQKPNSKNNNKE